VFLRRGHMPQRPLPLSNLRFQNNLGKSTSQEEIRQEAAMIFPSGMPGRATIQRYNPLGMAGNYGYRDTAFQASISLSTLDIAVNPSESVASKWRTAVVLPATGIRHRNR